MSLLNVLIKTATPISDLNKAFETPTGSQTTVQRLINLIEKLYAGGDYQSPSITLSINGAGHATQATGTVTLASAAAADTVTINGIVLTAVSGTPTSNQFKVGVSNTADALSLATAINNSVSALLQSCVRGSSVGAVCTITSKTYGAAGDQATLATSNGTRLAPSGARLTGGNDDNGTNVLSF